MASTYVAGGEREYGRYANPTWEAFESAIGELEGGRAISFASGMAAVSTVLDLVAVGATVVAARHCYNGTLMQLAALEQRGIVKPVFVDIDDTDQVVKALDEDTALLWIESPTNPALEVADLPALIKAAHDAGAMVVVDNTFATPLVQRPLSMGADVVIHSGTKYISGHSDALIGLVVTTNDDIFRAVDEKRRVQGAFPAPWRPGWRCAACVRCRCGSSEPRATPRNWRGGSKSTRRSSGCATPASAASSRSRFAAVPMPPTSSPTAPRCGCTRPASAASSRRWSAAAAGRRAGHDPGVPDPAQRRHRGRRRPLARPRPSPRPHPPLTPRGQVCAPRGQICASKSPIACCNVRDTPSN